MKVKIGIIGLGYVGLPLAVSFAKKFKVYGMDLDQNRIKDLKKFNDNTGEIKHSELKKLHEMFSYNPDNFNVRLNWYFPGLFKYRQLLQQ